MYRTKNENAPVKAVLVSKVVPTMAKVITTCDRFGCPLGWMMSVDVFDWFVICVAVNVDSA
jgi:hypothetical protein